MEAVGKLQAKWHDPAIEVSDRVRQRVITQVLSAGKRASRQVFDAAPLFPGMTREEAVNFQLMAKAGRLKCDAYQRIFMAGIGVLMAFVLVGGLTNMLREKMLYGVSEERDMFYYFIGAVMSIAFMSLGRGASKASQQADVLLQRQC